MGKKCEKVTDGQRCKKRAVYGKETKIPQYCKEHKDELQNSNMYIDVVHERCLGENCKMSRVFGPIGGKPLYCEKHSQKEMINLVNKKCLFDGCKTQAYYGLPNQRVTHCLKHKSDGMVDVKSIKCISDDCNMRPLFNKLGETKPLYCRECAKDKDMADVVNKCKEIMCKKCAMYGFKDKSKMYCETHKKDGMISVIDRKCFYYALNGCNKRAYYYYPDKIGEVFCIDHKKNGMISLKHKKCLSEWCDMGVTDKYDGYCIFCYVHLFPDKPVTRNYKTKEKNVSDYISESFPQYDWIKDKRIIDGCSNKRPDLLLDLGQKVIIIEIDENQHINYDSSCENKRLMEISKDLGHRDVVFIRFNPDDYINKDNLKIKSCWKQNKNGLVEVNNKNEWNIRLKNLSSQIQYWIDCDSNKMIEIIQLYYDQI
ncbi:MAG: hypothetical protein Terrestrivirus3_88 [Terrestrivirus sp.]|uniref:Endonuclease n=1 Tax=Terrestrivirus sp. TaxID=2487775 RepID=A0A3G4ZQW2_9VIRU|nr:MAG: hypothetical protein Terrestrivirus3_88 [Terrestrivirus sp.]